MKTKAYKRQTIWMIAAVVFLVAIPSTTAQAQQWETNGNNIYYNAGTVGIGTQNPGQLLHINSAAPHRLLLRFLLTERSEAVNLGGVQIHRPGTIGKALEPLAKGKGEILVLLSVQ